MSDPESSLSDRILDISPRSFDKWLAKEANVRIATLEAAVERLNAAEDEAGRHRATIKRLRVELGSIARIWENGGDRGWERSAQAYDMRCVARAALEADRVDP